MYADGVGGSSFWWTGRGTGRRSGPGSPDPLFWILSLSGNFMNVFQIGLVGRQEASVEGGVLSRLLYDLLPRHWFLDR